MTYKEYDNVFLETSYTSCPSSYIISRNLRLVGWLWWGNNYQPETGIERDFISKAKGEVIEIGPSAWESWDIPYTYAIGEGSYIYMVEEDVSNGDYWIWEWDIGRKEGKKLLAWNNSELAFWEPDFIFISYLEDHKVIVAPSYGYGYDGYDSIFLLDFNQMTTTLELTVSLMDEIEVLYVETIDGNIMAYAGGTDYDTKWIMYYKNFTTNTPWNSTYSPSLEYGLIDWIWENWQVCNNKYLCTTLFHDGSDTEAASLNIVSFNMYTYEWKTSNRAYSAYFVEDAYWAEPYFENVTWGNIMASDMTDGKLYIAHYGLWGYDYVPPYGYPRTGRNYLDYFKFFGVYDPENNILSTIYTIGWEGYHLVEPNTPYKVVPAVFTTHEHAYFFDCEDNNTLYDTSMSPIGTIEGYFSLNLCSIMDKDIVYYKLSSDYLAVEAKDINGNILKTWDLSPYNIYYIETFVIVGNGILIATYDSPPLYLNRQFLLI